MSGALHDTTHVRQLYVSRIIGCCQRDVVLCFKWMTVLTLCQALHLAVQRQPCAYSLPSLMCSRLTWSYQLLLWGRGLGPMLLLVVGGWRMGPHLMLLLGAYQPGPSAACCQPGLRVWLSPCEAELQGCGCVQLQHQVAQDVMFSWWQRG